MHDECGFVSMQIVLGLRSAPITGESADKSDIAGQKSSVLKFTDLMPVVLGMAFSASLLLP